MGKKEFAEELVTLLERIERGMLEFEEPLPPLVVTSIKSAIIALGEYILPTLHSSLLDRIEKEIGLRGCGNSIEILGEIGHPSSTSIIIETHKHSSYIDALACIQSLEKLKTEEGYGYLCYIVDQYGNANPRVIESVQEIVTACRALGEWNNTKAIGVLKQLRLIQLVYPPMPDAIAKSIVEAAELALSRYSDTQQN